MVFHLFFLDYEIQFVRKRIKIEAHGLLTAVCCRTEHVLTFVLVFTVRALDFHLFAVELNVLLELVLRLKCLETKFAKSSMEAISRINMLVKFIYVQLFSYTFLLGVDHGVTTVEGF